VTHLVLSISCPDRPGIVHAVSGALASQGGNILESKQFGDVDTGRFFLRIEAEAPDPAALEADLGALADTFAMDWTLDEAGRPMRTLIMVSTEGHCVSDLLYQQQQGRLPIEVVGIAGNHETLHPLADFYGIPFTHIPVTPETKAEAEAQLLRLIDDTSAELVVLARYMQILSPEVCARLAGNVINIHHSFLPSFKGARPYAQAHDRGVKLIGATAHYVTTDLDEGPIIEQDVERVGHDDDAEELRARGTDVERRVLSRAVRWHAQRRVLLNGHRTVVFA